MTSGLSRARLARLHEVLAGHVSDGDVPGLVAVVARRGEAYLDAIGATSRDGRDPIFRISSMTFWTAAYAAIDD